MNTRKPNPLAYVRDHNQQRQEKASKRGEAREGIFTVTRETLLANDETLQLIEKLK